MLGPVVVGVDGSPSSLAAVEVAAREAERRGVGLRLTHAIGRGAGGTPPGAAPWDPDGAAGRARMNSVLRAAEGRARREVPGLTISRDVLVGEPAAVLECAGRDAALTVVGSGPSRHRGLPRPSVGRLLGARGRGPVLVVRGRPARGGPVVLVDGGAPADRAAAEFAFAEAAGRGTELVVLTPRGGHPHSGRAMAPDLRTAYPDVAVRPRRVRGGTGRTLAEVSAGAQLVVVPARPRTSVLGAVPHATAGWSALRHAHCPVALVPTTAR
ncbi:MULTISPECIES: universal stress protein [unclassified Streptomyces]|uniref:universal stress protein n=1 Tax=unclassified Streptomyces TaxID=2593676 RepID=UPI001F0438D8|nr:MULTISPECIES: universal stress protein [unclassified Streptomyces]MCH0565793.1 universal stress protein [Streptomyces sp. MUM 2J]MCH0571048.1 universal stress protein [Streptomyces sp. MUM 136J]